MAKTLTEQPRRFSPTALDDRQFGDGAPLHSAIPFDLVRWINNLRSYRDPALQVLHDIAYPLASPANWRTRFKIKGVGGSGTCMLLQAPIYVPVGATKMRWSLGIYRHPAAGPDPPPVSMDVDSITMYLCSEPCRTLRDLLPLTIDTDNECCRYFDEADLTGAWTSNTVLAGANDDGAGDPVYDVITSDTWTDFAPSNVNNIRDRTETPWSNLICTAAFTAADAQESVRAAELSVWFEYADAEVMFDDAIREASRNGKPAMAQVLRRLVAALNEFSKRPRPLHSWVGGADIPSEPNNESHVYRQTITMRDGMRRIYGIGHVIPIANAAGVPKTGLTLNHLEYDQVFHQLVPQIPGRVEDINTPATDYYPGYLQTVPIFGEHVADYDSSPTARDIRVQIGEPGVYGPRPTAGVIMERRVNDPVIGIESLPTDPYAPGAEILGESTDPNRDLRALRDYFNMLALDKSIHFSWSCCRNGTGAFGMPVTDIRGTDYAYILNPAYGSGAGIAPTVDGPGIRLPLRYTAFGREVNVRAYFRILAKMTGTTNTAQLGYYCRNNSGGMVGPFAMTHTPTISGTTLQWYTSGNFNAAADCFAVLNANPAYDTDVFVPCVARNGITDNCLVVGFTVCIRATLV